MSHLAVCFLPRCPEQPGEGSTLGVWCLCVVGCLKQLFSRSSRGGVAGASDSPGIVTCHFNKGKYWVLAASAGAL